MLAMLSALMQFLNYRIMRLLLAQRCVKHSPTLLFSVLTWPIFIDQSFQNDLVQIINTEWGAFSKGLPLTEFDRDMDAASINPGEQVYMPYVSIVSICFLYHDMC